VRQVDSGTILKELCCQLNQGVISLALEIESVTTTRKKLKGMWVKPAVRQLRAGAAEVNTGTVDDGDPGSALNNS
jgi:hypothetical protein